VKKPHGETKLSGNTPHVSIGMPVFNGEKYLKEALDSILAQTYRDFELIISDNASTDRTEQICRKYATEDSRIRYYRNERNIGCPKNFNRVFELSSGELFKWAAYDDVHAPEFLRKCVSVLDKDPSVVLCHSRTGRIDERGRFLGNYDQRTLWRICSWKPHERFGDLISISYPKGMVYGVGRATSYRKTPLLESYIGADRNLMAEIGLMGRIIEIPEYLFFRRDHPEAYTVKFCKNKFAVSVDNFAQQSAYWSKDNWTSFPNWRNCAEFFRSVNRVRLKGSERLLCYDQIFRWFIEEGWFFMGGDIENLLRRRSSIARKLVPFVKLNLRRTVIPIIKKMRR
jgi:glycosyltransferase involved in cell wall biosynthesis